MILAPVSLISSGVLPLTKIRKVKESISRVTSPCAFNACVENIVSTGQHIFVLGKALFKKPSGLADRNVRAKNRGRFYT